MRELFHPNGDCLGCTWRVNASWKHRHSLITAQARFLFFFFFLLCLNVLVWNKYTFAYAYSWYVLSSFCNYFWPRTLPREQQTAQCSSWCGKYAFTFCAQLGARHIAHPVTGMGKICLIFQSSDEGVKGAEEREAERRGTGGGEGGSVFKISQRPQNLWLSNCESDPNAFPVRLEFHKVNSEKMNPLPNVEQRVLLIQGYPAASTVTSV